MKKKKKDNQNSARVLCRVMCGTADFDKEKKMGVIDDRNVQCARPLALQQLGSQTALVIFTLPRTMPIQTVIPESS